jgi:putative inorganic carbon (HCO3(-)) transporter
MSSHDISLPMHANKASIQDKEEHYTPDSRSPIVPPIGDIKGTTRFSSFWRDRLFEAGLVISMLLYYIIANPNIRIGSLANLNPLVSLPFLLMFAVLCWYRLPFAVALLPLTLPFYMFQKVVVTHYEFSLAELTLYVCAAVALLRLLLLRGDRQVRVAWPQLLRRLGPFAIPALIFLVTAALSIFVAYARWFAVRDFRKEIFDPLLYLVLALLYLRSRQDMLRLLAALLGTGALIALLGLVQYFLLKNTLVLEPDGVRRVHTVYGSANSIGLLFDYILPIVLAWLLARVSWRDRFIAALLCVSMAVVLYLTHSLGALIGIAVAVVFVLTFSLRNRRLLLIGALLALIAGVAVLAIYHAQITHLLFEHHVSQQGVSTTTKRLYLWQTALAMIHDSPWLGYGLDNWLCHYSINNVCLTNLHHYWILRDPLTGMSTGLAEEPTLSHPHNTFLHIWVSMGLFALLAFVSVLIFFYWLFTRILLRLHATLPANGEQLRWITVGIGAALLAVLVQGQVDSAFLEQDLSYCFWILVALLLLLRVHAGTSWRRE